MMIDERNLKDYQKRIERVWEGILLPQLQQSKQIDQNVLRNFDGKFGAYLPDDMLTLIDIYNLLCDIQSILNGRANLVIEPNIEQKLKKILSIINQFWSTRNETN